MSDDLRLMWWVIADAGMLVLAGIYLTWRTIRRANRRAGASGHLRWSWDDAMLSARTLLILCMAWWAISAARTPGVAQGQPSGSNEAAHARLEERAGASERRITKLESLPEVVVAQTVEQKRMREELIDLRKSVDDLISLQRNLFIGILLAVVAGAIQLLDRWASAIRKAKPE